MGGCVVLSQIGSLSGKLVHAAKPMSRRISMAFLVGVAAMTIGSTSWV